MRRALVSPPTRATEGFSRQYGKMFDDPIDHSSLSGFRAANSATSSRARTRAPPVRRHETRRDGTRRDGTGRDRAGGETRDRGLYRRGINVHESRPFGSQAHQSRALMCDYSPLRERFISEDSLWFCVYAFVLLLINVSSRIVLRSERRGKGDRELAAHSELYTPADQSDTL